MKPYTLIPVNDPCLGCFTLFATHLGRLSELGVLYPNVRVKHLDVDTSSGKLHCPFRLKDDSNDDVHYGLLLAASVGIPDEVSTALDTFWGSSV